MKKIKKVLTALMNENVNKELRKQENIEVLTNDLLYQEAVLEKIEENKEIDFILLNENLPGEELEQFIEKINKVKIILFVEKASNNKEKLMMKGIYKIFKSGEISIKDICKIINETEDDYTIELKKEIENLKRKIEEKEHRNEETKITKYIEKIKSNFKKEKNKENQIISITGDDAIVKAIIAIKLAQKYKRKRRKTLLIDFDILNQKINPILKVKNKEEINLNIENHIINKNKYFSILSGINLLFKINEQISIYEIEKIIEKLEQKYEYIIINTSLECYFEINKKLLEKSNLIYFLIEKNIKEIEKSKNLLKIYWNDFKLKKEKFNIILCRIKKLNKIKILENIPYSKEENGKNFRTSK